MIDSLINKAFEISQKFPVIRGKLSIKFMRFFVVGSTAFIINYTINNTLVFSFTKILDPDKTGRWIIVATSFFVAYTIAFVFNFTASRKWTFKSTSPDYKTQMVKFFIINAFNAISGSVVMAVLDNFGIPPYVSQPFFIATEMIWSYLLYSRWVFKS